MTRRRRRSPKNSTEPTYKTNANPTPTRVSRLHKVQHQHHQSNPTNHRSKSCPRNQPSIHPPATPAHHAIHNPRPPPSHQRSSLSSPYPSKSRPIRRSCKSAPSKKHYTKSDLTFEQGHESQRCRECTDRRRAGPSSRRGERCLGVDGRRVVCSL